MKNPWLNTTAGPDPVSSKAIRCPFTAALGTRPPNARYHVHVNGRRTPMARDGASGPLDDLVEDARQALREAAHRALHVRPGALLGERPVAGEDRLGDGDMRLHDP